jgi:hypothetical protein
METKTMIIANTLLSMVGEIYYGELRRASRNPRKASEKGLRHILDYAKDSEFGRKHDFAYILQAKDDTELYRRYREKVPVCDYEDMRPMVERHKNGEENILFPGKPVLYTTTSGTTSKPKWIPISKEYLDNMYGKMTKVWLYNFIKNRPKVFSGKVFSVIGKLVEGYAPDGTVLGSISGYTQGNCPGFLKVIYANPPCVSGITDYDSRYYVLMRMGIEQDVALIIAANPSSIVELQNNVEKYFDDYVDDIEHGTLKADMKIEPEIRAELKPLFKPNPKRAAELRAMKEKYGEVLPKHYWPNLQILNTWRCGNTSIYLDKFKAWFPQGMMHQEFGYISSECRFGFPLDDTLNSVLFPHYHYYEFVEESEIDKPDPHFLQVYELEEGKRYCIYITNASGFYRYNMSDLLEAGPCFKKTPTVHMIQKLHGIVTITGEKLHERQFIEAVHSAEKTSGLKATFFIGFADLDIKGYRFYYEFADASVSQQQAEKFTEAVDAALKEINMEYKAKRDSLRLPVPETYRLVPEALDKFKAKCIAEGARGEQFKLNLLLQDEARHAKFKQLVLK